MKKVLKASVAPVMALLMGASMGLAGNVSNGGGKGTCISSETSMVCSGTPVEFTGIVSDVNYAGSGMEVATDEGAVMVYGIGPYHYWESLGIDRPAVGDTVTVSGMEVDFNGTFRIVAMSITIGDQTAQLREDCVDGVGGQPLWRGGWQRHGK